MLAKGFLVILVFFTGSMSYGFSVPRPIIEKAERVELALELLEEQAGVALTGEQRAAVYEDLENPAANFVEVAARGNMDKSKAIYCVGGTAAAVTKRAAAICIHVWTLTPYVMQLIGAGMNFSLEIHPLLRAEVQWDSSRYDANFDPVPGAYGTVSYGGSLGGGLNFYAGGAGNKLLSITSLNIGIGLDVTSFSAVVISQ